MAGDGALNALELATAVADELGREAPELDPTGADLPPGGLEVYAPYFSVRTRFDAERARGLGMAPAPFGDYLPQLLAFADEARWGKRPLPLPPESLAA